MRKEIKCEGKLQCEKEDVMLGFNMKNEIKNRKQKKEMIKMDGR